MARAGTSGQFDEREPSWRRCGARRAMLAARVSATEGNARCRAGASESGGRLAAAALSHRNSGADLAPGWPWPAGFRPKAHGEHGGSSTSEHNQEIYRSEPRCQGVVGSHSLFAGFLRALRVLDGRAPSAPAESARGRSGKRRPAELAGAMVRWTGPAGCGLARVAGCWPRTAAGLAGGAAGQKPCKEVGMRHFFPYPCVGQYPTQLGSVNDPVA